MPLPMPKLTSTVEKSDFQYMSFEEAVTHPFTDEHQPSILTKPEAEQQYRSGDHHRRSGEQIDRVGPK